MLRLLLDAHISPRVAVQVRGHRPDCLIVSLVEWQGGGYREAKDAVVLAAAALDQLTLVTYDQHSIAPLLMEWHQRGQAHAGVIFVDERSIAPQDIGGLVRTLIRLWDREGLADWESRAMYLRT